MLDAGRGRPSPRVGMAFLLSHEQILYGPIVRMR